MFHRALLVVICCVLIPRTHLAADPQAGAPATPPVFKAGFAKRDVTPPVGIPMWGYGARHEKPSVGTLDPLMAKAVVIHAGEKKLAIVGLDIGRGPTQEMMRQIRKEIGDKAKIEHVLISGSHTHHGPVIELTDRPGMGRGKYDKAVAYSKKLPTLIIEAILEADGKAEPAKVGVAARSDLNLNRNRQSKRPVRATDPMLAAIRLDNAAGQPLAIIVNFAAHPVMTSGGVFKYSADYPGFMQNKVEALLRTNCLFMQGASGDQSVNADGKNAQQFGEELGTLVAELAKKAETKSPAKPSIAGRTDPFVFRSRIDFANPVTTFMFSQAFFPELVPNFIAEFKDGVTAELNTVVLNGEIALVGGSGEFFANHSKRLKERSYLPHTFFFGYCNGHSMYFPTIEAVSEGGYGADAPVAPAEIGAGEQMMNRALMCIYALTGKLTLPEEGPQAMAPPRKKR